MLGTYRVIKNAPFDLRWFSVSTGGVVVTGGTGPGATLSQDGGAFAASTNTPAETPASSGLWLLALTVAEMGCDRLDIKATYTGPRTPEPLTLFTEPCLDAGVIQTSTTTSTTLRAAAPSTGLQGMIIEIVRGTGSGQRPRMISSYNTTTKVMVPRPDWSTAPDNTSVYIVRFPTPADTIRFDGNEFGPEALSELYSLGYMTSTFLAGCTNSVLQTNMTGKGTEQLLNSVLFCLGVTNTGIMKTITDYNTTTGQITVYPPFAAAPSATERFAVLGTVG